MTVPGSTYRIQFNPGFTLTDAREVVDYLDELGVGAVYASPLLDATPGSSHGYDVTDPRRTRPELGGERARAELAATLASRGMGLVVDIVPNHMSIEVPRANPWWFEVLQHGRASAHAGYFDIDWSAGDRILVPVLGAEEDLASLRIDGDDLVYYEHHFPIAPGTGDGTPLEVHERQHYRLVDWRRGNTELNYRRFFDITTLAGVRVERREVFEDTHREVLRWVEAEEVTGLRVDHPDGLADPVGYLEWLHRAAPDAWIVIEKILGPDETLPGHWPVDGTTGYDALREISGVFIDPAGETDLTELARHMGVPTDFGAVEQEARRLITDRILVAEVRRIAALIDDIPAQTARAAVAETMIAFDVYRSYLPQGREHFDDAIARARSRRPDLGEALDVLNARVRAEPDGELATRIQQTSGMVVAKGTEDTAFYRYTRFAALNEVGGAPDRFGVELPEFHRLAAAREENAPDTMTTLTTHDTKRSEDTRARMIALSEVAADFAEAVAGWTERCGIDEPSLNLLAWQTLVSTWPISDQRLRDYLDKAAKESKIRTTWTDHDEEFERTVAEWPRRVRSDPSVSAEVSAFAERITGPGWSNSLSQKLVQLTCPGVPDVYQGTELWDFSLVDPDNRRPVDYELRRDILARIAGGELPPVDESGAAKLLLTHRALRLRRERPELFSDYRPLYAEGESAGHCLSFARSADLVTVATRLPITLEAAGGWGETVLPLAGGRWHDVLTGASIASGRIRVAELLDRYPVALLVRG